MTGCRLPDSADVELYFYDDLPAVDRGRVETHFRSCAACRQRLEDLHAVRVALASTPAVDTPAAGDWSGFMRCLDRAIAAPGGHLVESADAAAARGADAGTPSTVATPAKRTSATPRTMLALAATLALVAGGVFFAARFKAIPAATSVAHGPRQPVAVHRADARPDRALREGSAEHLERSKLVILGLATRDPHARAEDWQYERTLAATLLSETRLYRQAAVQDGVQDVERVMRDLETVLLEASMSDTRDRTALERVQRLIARRDLVLKMQVVAASGASGD